MILLFIIAATVIPAVIGRAALRFIFRKGKQPAVWESCTIGTMLCILMGEAIHLCTVFLHWPFRRFAFIYGLTLAAAFVLAGLAEGIRYFRKKEKTEWSFEAWMPIFGILVLLSCIFHIVMHVPDTGYDITLENVTTMLASDTVYGLNPMTGAPYEVGMPMRLKILALPSIYAAFCSWFGLEPQLVVYNWIPIFTMVLCYMVLFGWACYLYPNQKKKQGTFMLWTAVLLLFGNYAAMTMSYGLFHMGYRGEVFCAGVLYPYLLCMCLQKRKLTVLLCLLVEIGLVWTFYGLGGGLLICLFAVLTLFLLKRIDGRRKAA